ncbi:hypothetical protein LCGC14_2844800, partial [marine sediment metagenome]
TEALTLHVGAGLSIGILITSAQAVSIPGTLAVTGVATFTTNVIQTAGNNFHWWYHQHRHDDGYHDPPAVCDESNPSVQEDRRCAWDDR